MIQTAGRIETWQLDEIRRCLGREFPGSRIDDYPRGGHTAYLFTITEAAVSRANAMRHHLLVTRGFFDRFTDFVGLRDALVSGDVGRQLRREGEKTVTLY